MKTYALIVVSVAFYLSFNAQAKDRFDLGIGTYALNISHPNASLSDDDNLSGVGLNVLYAITDNFAIRGVYYLLEPDVASNFKTTGIDLVGYFGTGLATQGFKAYIGGGLYSENFTGTGINHDEIHGLQLNGGLGYNWEVVALDFVLGVRETSDYEDNFQAAGFSADATATAVSGSFILSVSFN